MIEIAGELLIGRSASGEGALGGDPELSRSHARVFAEPGGGLAVEDLGSTNGTFVNGERVSGARSLPPGSTLRMGRTDLLVEAVEEAATAPAPSIPAAAPAPPPPPPPVDPGTPPPPPGFGAPQQSPPPPPVPGAPHQLPAAHPAAAPAGKSGGGRGRLIAAALVGLLVIGGAIAAVLLLTGGDDKKEEAELPVEGPPALVSAARAAECTAVTEPSEGATHVDVPPRHKSNPPHSGDHALAAASDGRYSKAPPIGGLVHALEHGRIILWHKPGDSDVADELLEVGNKDAERMILTPNETDMEYAAAATAWTHLLGCPEWNDKVPAAIEAFRDAYRDKGPERVP